MPTTPAQPRIAAIILAAGSGSRADTPLPKQFRLLRGHSVLAYGVRAFAGHPAIGRILLVTSPDMAEQTDLALGELAGKVERIDGGPTRRESVRAALEYLAAQARQPDAVLIHDAARPGLPRAVIDRLISALADGACAAMPVLPVVDTLVMDRDGLSGDLVERDALRRVQTPQAFAFEAILAAHRDWPAGQDATDDAQMVRVFGHAVRLVMGDARLEKITLPGDHERMEQSLREELLPRSGLGFDVHRFSADRPLWLCGIEVPHSHGLSGHSDADVALHALVDALLGALAEGDIGSHFPPSDPEWHNAPSHRFLAFARDRVAARGGIIDHVDITIICEAPKIGPYRAAMRGRLSEILDIPVGRISVKATTTERLGPTGRGEGIAAQAIASLRLPDRN